MAEVIALCGKICSGKSHYAQRLREQMPAVILSCDELTLMLPSEHDVLLPKVHRYLMDKAVEIVRAGASVILDFGFWGRADRDEAKAFFAEKGISLKWRYIPVSDADWRRNIEARNAAVLRGEDHSYYVDEGLAQKCTRLFEAPLPGELD